ncbi:MAG: serine kinase [Xanthobacteraceae bacterium]|nr:serine kinase [Xanthobacteraceae bacterium]
MAAADTAVSQAASVYASAVLVGARAVLIRGDSGSGKSGLALALLQAAHNGRLPFARLISDDRTRLQAVNGRLLARPVPELAGLLEIRRAGIRQVPHEPVAAVFLVIDIVDEPPRMPDAGDLIVTIDGISLPRLAVASGADALPLVLAEIARLRPRQ